jgi:hypothetical protein
LIQIEVKDVQVEADCLTNTDCNASEYCAKEEVDCAGVGNCKSIPELCPLNLAPVVGCDGESYSNSCDANQAGINVLAQEPLMLP